MLFTSAIMPLFFRELSKKHEQNNLFSLKILYVQYSKLFFFISAFLSLYMIFNINYIIKFFIGQEYIMATIPASIYLLYPIQQTIGQLNGTFLFSIEKTKSIRNILIFISCIGIPISYLLLSDKSILFFNGFSLGAKGVAIKMIVVQIISVSMQFWVIAKFLKIKKSLIYFHQFSVLCLIFSINYTLYFFKNIIETTILNEYHLIIFISFSLIYLIVGLVIIYLFPFLIGLNKEKLKNYISNYF